MQRVRVLLAELTGVLGDVIRDVLRTHDDIVVVGDVPDSAGARMAVTGGRVDLVIWGTDRARASEIDALLVSHHLPKVLAVEDDGRHGSVWRLQYQHTALGQLSPRSLVDAIRRVQLEEPRSEG